MPATTSVDPRRHFSVGPRAARLTTTTELGRLRLHLIWLLVTVSLVPWRTEVYYAGGMDPTVVAKGALATVALVLAWLAASQKQQHYPVGARSFTMVVLFTATTALGGWAVGSFTASAVLSARVLLVAVIVMLVLMTYPMSQVVRTLCVVMGVVGLIAAAAGAGTISEGRLYGGIFPLNPNQIALLLSVPFLGLIWRIVHQSGHRHDIVMLLLLGGVTWLTGSRTGLVALLAATVVIVLQAQRLPAAAFVALVCAVPGTVYVLFSTNVAADYFGRGNEESVSSLSSRTIAWSAAFDMDTGPWQHWFGGGFAMKTIPVSGTYWDTQVLDSSWVSAYVQSGVFGMTLLGLWALVSMVAVFRCSKPWRGLLSALAVSCLIRSFTMSGLLDSSVLFVIFFVASVAAERGSRTRPPAGRGAAPAQSTELRRA